MSMPQSDFAYGVVSMARNIRAELERVKAGDCTLDQMDEWLILVITSDGQELIDKKDQKG